MIYTNAKIYTNGDDLHKREDLDTLVLILHTFV